MYLAWGVPSFHSNQPSHIMYTYTYIHTAKHMCLTWGVPNMLFRGFEPPPAMSPRCLEELKSAYITMYVSMCAYSYVHTHIRSACTHVRMHTYELKSANITMYVSMCAYSYVHVHIFACICLYTGGIEVRTYRCV